MKRIIQIAFFTAVVVCSAGNTFGQDKQGTDPDGSLKQSIYIKYKREVQAFDKKAFDALFFDFFQKQNDNTITLTKEEYYTYTIKIAIYSEKLGLLYKNQKEEAQRTKQEWFDKKYSDYLNSKH